MDTLRQLWIRITPQSLAYRFEPLVIAQDSMSVWANNLKDIDYKVVISDVYPVYEFAAPVLINNKRIGSIRYGISSERMRKSVQQLRKEFTIEISKYFIALLLVILLLLLYELNSAKKHASAITTPLSELTKAANTISGGNYNAIIHTTTNDEIGDLAADFEQMRQMIKRYTENLEQMVDGRTQQLNTALKEQLIQANKLVMLGTLVAGLAHEVNNPNNSILLSAGVLEEFWKGIRNILEDYAKIEKDFSIGGYSYKELSEELPLVITRIINNSRRIKTIVTDLKNFSRKDTNIEKQPVEINNVINEAIAIIESEIKKYTNYFTIEIQNDLPYVKGIPQQLEQVIVNLILNACQALDNKNKVVKVTTSHDDIKNQIIVEITDNGVGMDKNTLDNLLESFFTTKHHLGGTGLGLFVTSRIIKEHSGNLIFDSEPGRGTTAKVILPTMDKLS
jgi:signal transduction histidine kinase